MAHQIKLMSVTVTTDNEDDYELIMEKLDEAADESKAGFEVKASVEFRAEGDD